MVRGLKYFSEQFADQTDKFIFIGGTACELTLAGKETFRATHDIDMLVLAERIDPVFAEKFHAFIAAGGYSCYMSKDGHHHFYRFVNPKNAEYPPQIELLSRSMLPESSGMKFTPFSLEDDVRSMSAIVLTPEYYQYALANRTLKDRMPCLTAAGLIAFKVAAYLNLRAEHEAHPERVHSRDFLKHRNDVFRLVASINPRERVAVTNEIKVDLIRFLGIFKEDNPEWESILQSQGAVAGRPADYLGRMKALFAL